eukprot:SAG22_NODE_1366_length_4595_cov_5.475979_6_plen_92_part_00
MEELEKGGGSSLLKAVITAFPSVSLPFLAVPLHLLQAHQVVVQVEVLHRHQVHRHDQPLPPLLVQTGGSRVRSVVSGVEPQGKAEKQKERQ